MVASGHLDAATFLAHLKLSRLLFTITLALLAVWLLGYLLYVMVIVRPDRLFAYIGRDLVTNWATPERLTGVAIIYLFLPLCTTAFPTVKAMVPQVNPYSWDETFWLWDRVFHGGVDPWRLLHPILGSPAITSFVDWSYGSWYIMIKLMILWQAFSLRNPRLRLQFFYTLLLLWILLGNVLAIIWSSAGPVYFGRVTGLADPYGPLLTYLEEVNRELPLFVLKAHEVMWQNYVTGSGLGGGISAMPSMHVAIVALFAIVGWRVRPVVGVLLTLYAALILIGSVHLAWHYAVDGYVSIVLTWAIWWAVGKLQDLSRRAAQPDSQAAEEGSS
ncbi:MAG: phosphatase PAP2 family protein [Pseudomonadota bacterium]